jgi:hypothetical protein
MINTHERMTSLFEGGHPITVYSEDDATDLVDILKDNFKRKSRIGKFTITNEGTKWIVDYVYNDVSDDG